MDMGEVQRRLWEQSREHKEHRESSRPLFRTNRYEKRVRNLMDLMHHPDWLFTAMETVLERSRSKAPGIDGITFHKFMKRDKFKELEKLRLELKHGTSWR